MPDKSASVTFRITLRSQPSRATTASGHTLPDRVRLNHLLKCAGRNCGFKCVGIETMDEQAEELQESLR